MVLPSLIVLLVAVGAGAYLGFDLKSNNSPQAAGATTPTATSSALASSAATGTAVPPVPASGAIISSTEYSTPEPFPLCDPNGGQWLLVNLTPRSGGCVPNMQAVANNSGYSFGTLSSFPRGIPLTASSTVTVSGQVGNSGRNLSAWARPRAAQRVATSPCYATTDSGTSTASPASGPAAPSSASSWPPAPTRTAQSTTYDISLTFGSGTGKLGVTFSQGSASPLSETFSTGQFTPDAVGYALNGTYGNGTSAATIAGFAYVVR